jgi:DNA invertase Pin-like site-specific DNA recombinase
MTKKTVTALNKTRCLVYIRVSTDEQHLGPEAQAEACRVYAERLGMTVVETFRDIGVSGAAPLHECPGLQSAVDSLKALNAGVLLVAKRDRLARDVMKVGMVTQRVESAGATVISADGIPESNEPTAVLMRQIIDAFSQFERSLIISRTTAALATKKVKGEVTGNIPLGFVRDGNKLVVDEAGRAQHREVKARVQALLAEGKTYQNVVDLFAAEKVAYLNFTEWKFRSQVARVLERDL